MDMKGDEEQGDDETIITSNKSRRSYDSDDSITEASQETKQTKVIIEIQEMIRKMQTDQMKIMQHIKFMEDTVISLADENNDNKSYVSAIKTAKKLIKKRKIEESEGTQKQKESTKHQNLRRSIRLNKTVQQKKENEEKGELTVSKNNETEKKLKNQSIDVEDNQNDS